MKRGMATSWLYMSPDDMGFGLKSCVAVYLVELVRLLLQYKWGTIFRQEWFWRMEETAKKWERHLDAGDRESIEEIWRIPRIAARADRDARTGHRIDQTRRCDRRE